MKKGFSYKVKIEDLYSMNDSDPNRIYYVANNNVIRELVSQEDNYIKSIETSGGNRYQAEMDVSNANAELLTEIAKETGEDSVFYKEVAMLFSDERFAGVMHKMDVNENKAIEEMASELKKSVKYETIGKIIGFAILIVVVFFILYAISS